MLSIDRKRTQWKEKVKRQNVSVCVRHRGVKICAVIMGIMPVSIETYARIENHCLARLLINNKKIDNWFRFGSFGTFVRALIDWKWSGIRYYYLIEIYLSNKFVSIWRPDWWMIVYLWAKSLDSEKKISKIFLRERLFSFKWTHIAWLDLNSLGLRGNWICTHDISKQIRRMHFLVHFSRLPDPTKRIIILWHISGCGARVCAPHIAPHVSTVRFSFSSIHPRVALRHNSIHFPHTSTSTSRFTSILFFFVNRRHPQRLNTQSNKGHTIFRYLWKKYAGRWKIEQKRTKN